MSPWADRFTSILKTYEGISRREFRRALRDDDAIKEDLWLEIESLRKELDEELSRYVRECQTANLTLRSEVREIGYILQINLPEDLGDAKETEHELRTMVRA